MENKDKKMKIRTDQIMRWVKDLERIEEHLIHLQNKYLQRFYQQRKREIEEVIEEHLRGVK
jgi:ferritin-like metal-binding protein YciE